MNGYVVSDDDAELYRYFGFSVVSPRDVRQAIADNPEGEPLTLEVNSGGGSMFAGYEIYTILKAAGIPTEVEIQSLAGDRRGRGARLAGGAVYDPPAEPAHRGRQRGAQAQPAGAKLV